MHEAYYGDHSTVASSLIIENVQSYQIRPQGVILYHIIPTITLVIQEACHVMSFHVMSGRVMTYHIMPYPSYHYTYVHISSS